MEAPTPWLVGQPTLNKEIVALRYDTHLALILALCLTTCPTQLALTLPDIILCLPQYPSPQSAHVTLCLLHILQLHTLSQLLSHTTIVSLQYFYNILYTLYFDFDPLLLHKNSQPLTTALTHS